MMWWNILYFAAVHAECSWAMLCSVCDEKVAIIILWTPEPYVHKLIYLIYISLDTQPEGDGTSWTQSEEPPG